MLPVNTFNIEFLDKAVELINPSVIYYIVYTKYKLNETCKDCAILTFVYRLT